MSKKKKKIRTDFILRNITNLNKQNKQNNIR